MDKKLLSNLYALRSNLSQLSLLKDETDKYDKEINTMSKDIVKCDNDINSKQAILDKSQDDLKQDRHLRFIEHNRIAKGRYDEILRKIPFGPLQRFCLVMYDRFPCWSVGFLISLSSFIALMVIHFGQGKEFGHQTCINILMDYPTAHLIIVHFGFIILFGLAWVFFAKIIRHVCDKTDIKKQKEREDKASKIYEEKYGEKYYIIDKEEELELDNSIEENRIKDVEQAKKDKENFVNKSKSTIAIKKNEYSAVLDASKNLYQAIRKNYNSIIDERDWGYLDLIIYYIETGRAETMKEALQLVDQEVQINRIVNSINKATKTLSDTITSTINDMRNDMNRNFMVVGEVLFETYKLQANQNELMEQTINRLANAEETNKALLKKIAVSSVSLAEDARYLNNYQTNNSQVFIEMSKIENM